jgi:hypothetical protein
MRSLREIKESIGHAKVESKPEADRVVLRHLLTEFAAATGNASTPAMPCAWRALAKGRVVKAMAAAAIVILALFLVGRPPHKVVAPRPEIRPPSAADLLTVGHLNAACRRGGLEAIEQQCEEAARRLDNRPERVSAKELIREFKGTQPSKG